MFTNYIACNNQISKKAKRVTIYILCTILLGTGCASNPHPIIPTTSNASKTNITNPSEIYQRAHPTTFGIGSSHEEVTASLGAPKSIYQNEYFEIETWIYSNGTITFEKGRVSEWRDYGENFPIQQTPQKSLATTEKISTGIRPQISSSYNKLPPPKPSTYYIPTYTPDPPTYYRSSYTPSASTSYTTKSPTYYPPNPSSSASYPSNPSSTHVRGYTRKDGTYVAPYYRSNANSSKMDNWSTRGNYNPYTGKRGSKSHY